MTFVNLSEVDEIEKLPGFQVRFVHSANMTFAHWNITGGARLPEHSHPHEQVATVLEGEFELIVEGDSKILGPGTVAIIPSNAKHSGTAITDCKILDTFYPIREDYR